MTTIAINSHLRPSSNGGISALIVSMGLVVILGAAMSHVRTGTEALADEGATSQPSANFSGYRFVVEGQLLPLNLGASSTVSTPRGLRRVIQPRRTVLKQRLFRVTCCRRCHCAPDADRRTVRAHTVRQAR